MGDFLWALLLPPFGGCLIGLIGICFGSPRPAIKAAFFLQWRLQALWFIIGGMIGLNLPAIWGGSISGLLAVLLDDDMRKKGKKAAKQLGDKSRRIIAEMVEKATPRVLRPLPGLSAFR